MANNVKKEFELYEPMRVWLQQYLEDKYKVEEIQPVDMFPFTSHVECCSVLKLKKSTEI